LKSGQQANQQKEIYSAKKRISDISKNERATPTRFEQGVQKTTGYALQEERKSLETILR
jgi:hypothetical protein